jgi:predicted transcriptional regulator
MTNTEQVKLQKYIAKGYIIDHGDSTYSTTEKGRDYAIKKTLTPDLPHIVVPVSELVTGLVSMC